MIGQAEGVEGAIRGAVAMATVSFLKLIYLSMTEPSPAAD